MFERRKFSIEGEMEINVLVFICESGSGFGFGGVEIEGWKCVYIGVNCTSVDG